MGQIQKPHDRHLLDRRSFLRGSLAAAAFPLLATPLTPDIDLSALGFDIEDPKSHCIRGHHHDPLPRDIDPVAELNWSAQDTGFNVGCEEAARLLLRSKVDVPPETMAKAAGNVWKRREMMAFAKELARNNRTLPVAVGLAILSQWHNCHAFRTLVNNVPAVVKWLRA